MGTAFDVDTIIKKILDTLIKTLRDTLASLLMKAANVSCKWEALKDEPSLLETQPQSPSVTSVGGFTV